MKRSKVFLAVVLSMSMVLMTACSSSTASPQGAASEDAAVSETEAAKGSVSGAEQGENAYQVGTYVASAEGKNGLVTVEVTFDETSISSVVVTEHSETPGICDGAIEQIPEAIVDQQSLAVDAVTSATITSEAILAAVEDCVLQAGGDVESLKMANTDAQQASLVPGIYEGTAHGFTGDTTVHVTVDEASILKVDVVSCTDVPINISRVAVTEVPQDILKYQSTRVDGVSGATFTSNAIKAAVTQALEKAGNASRFAVEMEPAELAVGDSEDVDILVLGGGGSGCMSALYAQNEDLIGQDTGLKVMLVEKQGYLGGSLMLSGGFIGAAMPLGDDTNLNNPDMLQAYIEGEQARQPQEIDHALLERIARTSNTGVLNMQKLGLPMMTAASTQDPSSYTDLIGWSLLSHSADDPSPDGWKQAGDEIGRWFERRLRQTNVDVRLNTTADELLVEDGAVTGAIVHDQEKTYTVRAKKVIIACGSFISSQELMDKYYPEASGCPLYANGGNTGDGLRMVTDKFGIEPVIGRLMDGYFGLESRYGIDNDLRSAFFEGSNSIFVVNKDGERFTNDAAGFNIHTMHEGIIAQPDKVGYVIVDSRHVGVPDIEASVLQNYIVRGDTLADVANELGIDAAKLQETADTYLQVKNGNGEDVFGVAAEDMISLTEAPFYGFPMYSVQTATFSGFLVNENCELLGTDGQPIENLYAVGETAYGGASVAGALFTGSIAGIEAANRVLNNQ